MKDLTVGSIPGHIVTMAIPIMTGMLLQTLYYMLDLYFVSRLGDTAVAGVSGAANAMFIVFALVQMLSAGSVALISQAVGGKDQERANLIFNQSFVLSALCGLTVLLVGYACTATYMREISADLRTAQAGTTYFYWFLPGLALQFAMFGMASGLRGTGIVRPAMVVQAITVVLNIVLAPVLIRGWGTNIPLGVAGAGLATSIAVAAGVLLLHLYFAKTDRYVSLRVRQWAPRLDIWANILRIGLPVGGEFLLMFVYAAVTFWAIRGFGAHAQAGFGIGYRVMQAIFFPAMAIALSIAAIIGQNYGARKLDRVRAAFRAALLITGAVMAVLTVVCSVWPERLVEPFTGDTSAIAVGAAFLQVVAWKFMGSGIVYTCSSTFQGLGNTVPPLLSSASRVVTFVAPAIWLQDQPWFELRYLWYLYVAGILLQALLNLSLLRREFRLRFALPKHAVHFEPGRIE